MIDVIFSDRKARLGACAPNLTLFYQKKIASVIAFDLTVIKFFSYFVQQKCRYDAVTFSSLLALFTELNIDFVQRCTRELEFPEPHSKHL